MDVCQDIEKKMQQLHTIKMKLNGYEFFETYTVDGIQYMNPPSNDYYGYENSGCSDDEDEDTTDGSFDDDEEEEQNEKKYEERNDSLSEEDSSGSLIDNSEEENDIIEAILRGEAQVIGEEEPKSKENEDNDTSDDDDDGYDDHPFESNLLAFSQDYKVQSRISVDENTVVYSALTRWDGQKVAIKIHNEPGFYKEGGLIHPKEVRALSRCQGHPGVVKMVAWHSLRKHSTYALVTELVENASLPVETVLFSYPDKIREYVFQVLVILDWIHSRKVLYRDVKPSNFMWNDKERRVTCIDFDCSTFLLPEHLGGHSRHLGTGGYRAPEMQKSVENTRAWRKDCRRKRDNYRQDLEKWYNLGEDHQIPNPQVQARPAGYGLAYDVYGVGCVLSQLVFGILEQDMEDDSQACGGSFYTKVKRIRRRNIKRNKKKNRKSRQSLIPVFDLIYKMLDPDPCHRISVKNALKHRYFTSRKSITPLSRLPPWLAMSEFVNDKSFWTKQTGSMYTREWKGAYMDLTETERIQYRQEYPPPPGWYKVYE